jgi:hypothetical protein
VKGKHGILAEKKEKKKKDIWTEKKNCGEGDLTTRSSPLHIPNI